MNKDQNKIHSLLTISQAWQWFLEELHPFYPEKELQAIGKEIFRHFFSMEPAQRVINAPLPMEKENFVLLRGVVEQLKQHIPLQYITGLAHFLDLELEVDRRVLIPRPETEELVLWILDTLKKEPGSLQAPWSVLDVGTGSGCIPIALARKMPNARIMACDVSKDALELATQNARKNQVKVGFFPLDILHDDPPLHDLDVVVSNPPYVMEKEKPLMKPNVLDHEPHAALFVPDEDPLIFYRTIASKAISRLRPGGFLFLEINENLAHETRQCIEKEGFVNNELKKDLNGRDRMLRGRKPGGRG